MRALLLASLLIGYTIGYLVYFSLHVCPDPSAIDYRPEPCLPETCVPEIVQSDSLL